jgi:hypothetical protein
MTDREQKPVAWWNGKESVVFAHDEICTPNWTDYWTKPLYAVPPQRQWIGLTNQERNHIWQDFIGWGDPSHDDENLMKAIEGKLKEKNT